MNRCPHPEFTHQKAFSLLELLLVISVFTIISAASYPIINNFGTASDYSEAQAKAEALTAAKILYWKNDATAEASWDAAGTDSSKFDLLKPYLEGVASGVSLTQFAAAPPYHQFDLGAGYRDRVTIVEGE